MSKSSIAVVVLNWNDANLLPKSVGSLLKQSKKCDIIVVDNASEDNSEAVINSFGKKIIPLWNKRNLGFAGGVNTGIRYAIARQYEYIALLNNDAEASLDWAKNLQFVLTQSSDVGCATCSLLSKNGKTYDSTGDYYTSWGLPYPRGRGEKVRNQYNDDPFVIAVSGGASMFKRQFFEDVGLYDEDFFAYYEDVDLGLRGQLRGWRARFVPEAVAYHATGTTSGRVRGFTTYQTMKNLPWVMLKNVPLTLLPAMSIRFTLAYIGFILSALQRKQFWFAIKGMVVSLIYTPKKLWERRTIQSSRKIDANTFYELLSSDLPPNAAKLRKIRHAYWRIRSKKR